VHADEGISRRVADVLVYNVSIRKYARVVHRCAAEVGISKSAVSRQFVKQSAQALAKLMERDFAQVDLVAIYVDGIIVAKHHIIAAVGVDATGRKYVPAACRTWESSATNQPQRAIFHCVLVP
jgi:predicted transcriptional regulator